MSEASAQAASPLWDDASITAIRRDMLRFARMQLRDAAAAEDMVQEALMAAMTSAKSFAGRSAFKTWVFAILRNKIVDRIRQRCREAPLPEAGDNEAEDFDGLFEADGHWADKPADWGDPERSFEQGRFFDVLELCMKALPENLSRVFLMREVLEMETEEICKELAISSSNCWVVLYRARMRLRECLQLKWFGQGVEA